MENGKINIDNSLKLIVKSSFVVFTTLVVSKILVYAYRIIVARYYGAEIYGVITLTLVVASIAVTIASFGIPQGLYRFIPKYIGERQSIKVKYIMKKTIVFLTITSLTASIILLFSADYVAVRFFKNENLGFFLKMFSLTLPLWILSNVFMTTLAALEKIAWSSFLNNVVLNLVKLVVLIILIFFGVRGEAVLASYVVGYVFLFLISMHVFNVYTKNFFREKNGKDSYKNVMREFYSFSLPLVLTGIVAQIFFWADSITIGFFLGVEDVGFYNAAIPLALLFFFAPEIFTKLFFPMVNREYSGKNFWKTKQLSQQIGKWILMVNLPLLVIFLSFPEQIITFVFGNEYVVAANSLRILAVGSFVLAQANISEKLILVSGKSKIILRNTIITSIIGIMLNIILIQIIGISGAALSTSLMYILLSGLLISEAKKNASGIIPIRRKALRIVGISLGLLIGLNIAKIFVSLNFVSVVATAVVVIVVYVLLIYYTKSLDEHDIAVLKSVRKKFIKR